MKTDMHLTWLPPQFDFKDRRGSKGQRGALRVGREVVLPVLRSLDSEDAVLGVGLYQVAMERMATKKTRGEPRRALIFVARWDASARAWGPSFARRGLAVHDFGTTSDDREVSGFPAGLDGCVVPGVTWRRDAVVLPVTAMERIFAELGGWREHARFTLQILP